MYKYLKIKYNYLEKIQNHKTRGLQALPILQSSSLLLRTGKAGTFSAWEKPMFQEDALSEKACML